MPQQQCTNWDFFLLMMPSFFPLLDLEKNVPLNYNNFICLRYDLQKYLFVHVCDLCIKKNSFLS